MRKLTKDSNVYEIRDRLVRVYLKRILRRFKRLNQSLLAFDEINGLYAVNACYEDVIAMSVECLKEMDGLLIEANHDVRMLQTGSYPYYLKQRILGDRGHLSNENSGKLLSRILADRTKFIFLGHLSHENNLPELAYEAVRAEITMGDNPYRAEDFRIMIAKRDEPSPIVTL